MFREYILDEQCHATGPEGVTRHCVVSGKRLLRLLSQMCVCMWLLSNNIKNH